MLSLIFMTSSKAQSPPKLFNMDAVEADTYTHTHANIAHACTHKRMDIVLLCACTLANTHTHTTLFAPKTMHGWCFAPADDEEW